MYKVQMSSPCNHFDFTMPEGDISHKEIIEKLYPTIVKKYVFQLEEGDSGYLHYQGRFSLIKKRRLGELVKLIKLLFPQMRLSTTSNNGLKEENFYCIKQDTRKAGPWTDTDPKPEYIPRQIREIKKLHPWQQSVIEKSAEWDTRSINIIHDTEGNIGKSTLATWMGVHKLGKQLPYCNDYKDILRMVMCLPTSKCYLIDMPRAICKDKLFQMYSAIETVKSGYAYDDRYHFKDKYFDCPNIWVFTNVLPDADLLSSDRWKYWEIIDGILRIKANCVL